MTGLGAMMTGGNPAGERQNLSELFGAQITLADAWKETVWLERDTRQRTLKIWRIWSQKNAIEH